MSTEFEFFNEWIPNHIKFFLIMPPVLLKNFHHDDVKDFLKIGLEEKFQPDDIIINEDENVNSAYLVAEGKVAIWKDNIQLAILSKGDFLGEAFLFSKHTRMAKVTAEGKCTLLKFDRYKALNFFKKKPEKLFNIFTKNIIEIQLQKINNMNIQLSMLKKSVFKNLDW